MSPTIYFEALVSLALIIVLIYLCYFAMKKRFVVAQSAKRIKILEQQHLDNRLTLSLVTIDNHEMVVIFGQNGATMHPLPSLIETPKQYHQRFEQIH